MACASELIGVAADSIFLFGIDAKIVFTQWAARNPFASRAKTFTGCLVNFFTKD